MKFILIVLLSLFASSVCFGQSKPLDLSVTLSDLNNYQALSGKGQANGYTPLNSNSLVPPNFLFPGFSSSQDGTIWSKSGSSWLAISNLTVQPFSLVVSLARIGKLSPPGVSVDIYGIGTELSTIPLVLYGGNSRVYVANGQTIGGANVNFNNFTWSIDSSGNFDLNSGIIKNGLSLNNTSISNISSMFTSNGLSINFTNNRITSLQSGRDIIFVGDDFGVQVPNINTNNLLNSSTSEITKNYALNVRSADLLYVAKNSSNNWTLPQVFSGGISLSSPLSISNGGTGATNAAQARQNLGITTGITGGFQSWSPVLSSLSSNTPTTNNFLVGASSAWVSRTPAQVRSILGIEIGSGGLQPYSETLNYISTIVTNNSFGSKYIFVGDPTTETLTARTAALARSDLGLEINSTNGVQAYSVYLRDIVNLGIPQLDEFLVGSGTTWTKKDPENARQSLGLGTTNIPEFSRIRLTDNESTLVLGSQSSGISVSNLTFWFSHTGSQRVAIATNDVVLLQDGGALSFGTNNTNGAAITRTNLGLGATWLTNTNVTNFRTAIGLGSTNVVFFESVGVANGLNVDGQTVLNGELLMDEGATITFGDNVAATRTNLGLGATWLTNTDATTFLNSILSTNSLYQVLTLDDEGGWAPRWLGPANFGGDFPAYVTEAAAVDTPAFRNAIGLSATWLTNTNVTNFRTAIGLGANDTVQFAKIGNFGTNIFRGPIDIEGTSDGMRQSIIATTRTNLGLPWSGLTNTNANNFRIAIGLESGLEASSSLRTFINNSDSSEMFISDSSAGLYDGPNDEWALTANDGKFQFNGTNRRDEFLSALGIGTAATNASTDFQAASTNLSTLAENNAVNLTNFPALLLRTNGSAAGLTNFPALLLRTNGSAAGLTNFPTLNQSTTGKASNVTGVVAITNGGTGANNSTNARNNLGLGGGINETKTFVSTDNITNTVIISNGIITSWTQN